MEIASRTLTEVGEDMQETLVLVSKTEVLASIYGEKVGQLYSLLTVFGLGNPTSLPEATVAVYEQSKQDPTKLADAVLLLTVYQDLKNHLTDDQILDISLLQEAP